MRRLITIPLVLRPLRLLGPALLLALGCQTSLGAAEPPSPPAAAIAPMVDVNQVVTTSVGEKMPAWSVTTLDGRTLSLQDLAGKVVILDFWATYCAPCVHEVPAYIALQNKYREQGLVVVGVSADRKEALVTQFIARHGVNYPVAMLNYEIGEALIKDDSVPLPLTFFVDRAGVVRHQKIGALSLAEMEKHLTPLL